VVRDVCLLPLSLQLPFFLLLLLPHCLSVDLLVLLVGAGQTFLILIGLLGFWGLHLLSVVVFVLQLEVGAGAVHNVAENF
jgi:hypothetical protein